MSLDDLARRDAVSFGRQKESPQCVGFFRFFGASCPRLAADVDLPENLGMGGASSDGKPFGPDSERSSPELPPPHQRYRSPRLTASAPQRPGVDRAPRNAPGAIVANRLRAIGRQRAEIGQ